jgi:dolichol-phosphate mannosyltransferase
LIRTEENSVINQLNKLSVVIPARNEADNLNECISDISNTLNKHKINYEILLIDDGSTDNTKDVTNKLQKAFSPLRYLKNENENGFGRAIRLGLDNFTGDAVVIMMADRSDSSEDLIQYWQVLLDGSECAFGSRFIKGSKLNDYPRLKLVANRVVNTMIRYAFKIKCNDVTNAFKMYRREVIDGCRPFISPHFNLTVEIPLKAIVRGYTWKVIPISWRNRTKGVAKLKLKEMGSRYFFIIAYLWLEKYFSRGDYLKK